MESVGKVLPSPSAGEPVTLECESTLDDPSVDVRTPIGLIVKARQVLSDFLTRLTVLSEIPVP
jgi:hypothetical protein